MNRVACCVLLALMSIVREGLFADDGPPQIQLLATLRIPGNSTDKSGLTATLEDGSPSNRFGGLSAIDCANCGDRFFLLSDRGASDGAVSFPCRFQIANLRLDESNQQIHFELSSTSLLTSPKGHPLIGSIAAHEADLADPSKSDWTAFDPEGLRLLTDGTIVISDEYGPRVTGFTQAGRFLETYAVPKSFRLRAPVDGVFKKGAFPNRGLEGLAVTPAGDRWIAAIQSPLVQDGEIEADKCLGLNCRWIVYDSDHKPKKQIVYRLENLKSGVSEILAVNKSRFLVLERDSKAGSDAKLKRIYLVDIRSATDVSELKSLPKLDLPEDVTAVSKSLLIDLLDDQYGIAGESAPEKPEGLAWGKSLSDGRRTLWVCCDNDFVATQDSFIYCFAVAESALTVP